MRKKTILSMSIAILSAAGSIAQNFTATYNFNDVTNTSGLTDPTPAPVVAGAAFGGFSAVGTSANSNASGRFSFTNWPIGATTGDDVYSSLTGSVNTSEYYEVTVGPENGNTLDLTGITFSVRRSGTGIRTYIVRSSLDGYISNLPASIDPVNAELSVASGDIFFWNLDATTSNQNGSTITLGGANYTGLTSAVTFRFYGYNSEGSAGTFSIDNVAFTGTVNSISTSIARAALTDVVRIYPNPSASGIFTIDVSANAMVTVCNIIGKAVFIKELNAIENSIDLSAEANGSYFITIKNDTVISTQKILINK
ncbi:MAG: T9SS type A sorting domain-containing protein [Bacteroidota bacterium]